VYRQLQTTILKLKAFETGGFVPDPPFKSHLFLGGSSHESS
jgi:hypothetical protein